MSLIFTFPVSVAGLSSKSRPTRRISGLSCPAGPPPIVARPSLMKGPKGTDAARTAASGVLRDHVEVQGVGQMETEGQGQPHRALGPEPGRAGQDPRVAQIEIERVGL